MMSTSFSKPAILFPLVSISDPCGSQVITSRVCLGKGSNCRTFSKLSDWRSPSSFCKEKPVHNTAYLPIYEPLLIIRDIELMPVSHVNNLSNVSRSLTLSFFTRFMYALLFSSMPPWEMLDMSAASVPLISTLSMSSTVVNSSLFHRQTHTDTDFITLVNWCTYQI